MSAANGATLNRLVGGLRPAGVGYYKSDDGRATAVRVTFQDDYGQVHGEWAGRLDGNPVGRGSLKKVREMIRTANTRIADTGGASNQRRRTK